MMIAELSVTRMIVATRSDSGLQKNEVYSLISHILR